MFRVDWGGDTISLQLIWRPDVWPGFSNMITWQPCVYSEILLSGLHWDLIEYLLNQVPVLSRVAR